MEMLEQKVKDALKKQFKDEDIQFHHDPGERIHGIIISDKFEGLDFEARHELIWNLLRAHLAPEERQQVLSFIDYTPAEIKAYTEAFSE